MLRTGQLLAPSQGHRCSASTAGSRPPPGAALPGTLASPRTGLTPAGCRELVVRIRRSPPFSLTPELLDARRVRKLGQGGFAEKITLARWPVQARSCTPRRSDETTPLRLGDAHGHAGDSPHRRGLYERLGRF